MPRRSRRIFVTLVLCACMLGSGGCTVGSSLAAYLGASALYVAGLAAGDLLLAPGALVAGFLNGRGG